MTFYLVVSTFLPQNYDILSCNLYFLPHNYDFLSQNFNFSSLSYLVILPLYPIITMIKAEFSSFLNWKKNVLPRQTPLQHTVKECRPVDSNAGKEKSVSLYLGGKLSFS